VSVTATHLYVVLLLVLELV